MVLTGAGKVVSAGGNVRQMGERPSPALAQQRLAVLYESYG
jgi:2-(1,2-epoxy-1,2-dihydrophenyl)acetyl-CoA isomerase